jgi:hypothetical protein
MIVLWIAALGIVLVAIVFIAPAVIFRPEGELAKYVALVPASLFLTLSVYLMFVWSLDANDGAPSSIVIVPLAFRALGALAGLVGLAWLWRFLALRPARAYWGVLAFLPCFWVAHPQPALMKERHQASEAGRKWAEAHPHADQVECIRESKGSAEAQIAFRNACARVLDEIFVRKLQGK